MLLELIGVRKSFEGNPVLDGISFGLGKGEIIALLGPSGCGKTTLLRIIAGLESPDQGRILLNGDDLTRIPVHERRFGLVFQDYALFPHKSVSENVDFGLRMLGWEEERRSRRVEKVLDLVGLHDFGERSVHSLSGGEQQRVALARSLAPSPRLLLLDEPLGSLDRALRERLMGDLRLILKQAGDVTGRPEGITAIYVTHDQEEAFAIADRVLIMNAGHIEQSGTPVELFSRPVNAYVARFLGMGNLLEAQLLEGGPPSERPIVSTAAGNMMVSELPANVSNHLTLLVRPESGRLIPMGELAPNIINGRLLSVSFRGRYQIVTILVISKEPEVKTGDITLKLEFEASEPLPELNSEIRLSLNPEKVILLDGE
jgi:ABC-type Fe3+/spermidine/putrescine transport system ATPase subunit